MDIFPAFWSNDFLWVRRLGVHDFGSSKSTHCNEDVVQKSRWSWYPEKCHLQVRSKMKTVSYVWQVVTRYVASNVINIGRMVMSMNSRCIAKNEVLKIKWVSFAGLHWERETGQLPLHHWPGHSTPHQWLEEPTVVSHGATRSQDIDEFSSASSMPSKQRPLHFPNLAKAPLIHQKHKCSVADLLAGVHKSPKLPHFFGFCANRPIMKCARVFDTLIWKAEYGPVDILSGLLNSIFRFSVMAVPYSELFPTHPLILGTTGSTAEIKAA